MSKRYSKSDYKNIAEALVEDLRECDNGTVTSTHQLLMAADYENDDFDPEDFFEIHDVLCRAAKANRITLDSSAHKDKVQGLPYDLDFVVGNRKAQIKCPHCGSTDTARYIYGYPMYNENMKRKLDAGKWILGGCCIETVEINGQTVNTMATRRCNKCKKDFGSAPILYDQKKDHAEDYRDIATSVRLWVGGFFDGYTDVIIRKTEDGALVEVIKTMEYVNPEPKKISAEKWQKIVNKLYSECYINEWKKNYADYNVLDGTQWGLEIKLSNNSARPRIRHYKGSNAFPPYWNDMKKVFWEFA